MLFLFPNSREKDKKSVVVIKVIIDEKLSPTKQKQVEDRLKEQLEVNGKIKIKDEIVEVDHPVVKFQTVAGRTPYSMFFSKDIIPF